jgi:ketosteroid isomerase-like protein
MPEYTETELRNLHVVRRFLNEEPPPDDKSELFAEDGVWWNGLALIHPEGGTEHRGREAIRRLLPSQNVGAKLLPGRDRYDMSTAEIADVITLADGDFVVRQQTFRATTMRGRRYENTYCFVFRFNEKGEIAYLTEHWNTWHAARSLLDAYDVPPARPFGDAPDQLPR